VLLKQARMVRLWNLSSGLTSSIKSFFVWIPVGWGPMVRITDLQRGSRTRIFVERRLNVPLSPRSCTKTRSDGEQGRPFQIPFLIVRSKRARLVMPPARKEHGGAPIGRGELTADQCASPMLSVTNGCPV